MNIPLAAAAALSALTVVAHVFGGGPEIHDVVLESSLSLYLKAIFSVIWHAVTVVLVVNSVAFGFAATSSKPHKPLILLISAQYALWGGLFIYYGLSRLETLWLMPQWTVFFLVPILALFGLRQTKSPSIAEGA